MELKWLLDFVSLAKTGNFSRSAEHRNVTQSAFSRRIQALENWLGTELVDRTSHPVSLTNAGIRFLSTAKYIIQLASNIQEDFDERRKHRRESIAFSASTNLAITFLPRWVAQQRRQFGEFDISVKTDIAGVNGHFKMLESQQSDLMIHYGHGVEMLALDASRFESIDIGTDVLLPVCHRSLLGNGESMLPSRDGKALPYLSPRHSSLVANTIAGMIAEIHPETRLDTKVESSIIGCTKGFVCEGLGLGWLPKSLIEEELSSGQLVIAADQSYAIPLSIQLYRYTANSKSIVRKFWDHVLQQYH